MSSADVSPGWEQIDKKRYFVIGPACSFAVRTVLYPLTVIKVRQQVLPNLKEYATFRSSFAHIVRVEGAAGLFKGFGPSLLGIPVGQLYLTSYEIIRQWMGQRLPHSRSGQLLRDFSAGALATAIAQTIGVPIDIVTQRLQANTNPELPRSMAKQMRTAMDIGTGLCRERGFRGLYSGYLLQMAQFAPTSGLWWFLYNEMVRTGSVAFAVLWPQQCPTHGAAAAASSASSRMYATSNVNASVNNNNGNTQHSGGGDSSSSSGRGSGNGSNSGGSGSGGGGGNSDTVHTNPDTNTNANLRHRNSTDKGLIGIPIVFRTLVAVSSTTATSTATVQAIAAAADEDSNYTSTSVTAAIAANRLNSSIDSNNTVENAQQAAARCECPLVPAGPVRAAAMASSATLEQAEIAAASLSTAQMASIQAVAGGLSAAVLTVVTHPVDVVRTRVQVLQGKITAKEAFSTLFKQQGLLQTLTKGIGARIMGAVPSSVLMISYYEMVKRLSSKSR